jgi:chromosome segregation ATPase
MTLHEGLADVEAERDALRARAEAAEAALASTRAEADRLRAAITAAVDALPEWSAELVAEALRDALAEAEPPVTA